MSVGLAYLKGLTSLVASTPSDFDILSASFSSEFSEHLEEEFDGDNLLRIECSKVFDLWTLFSFSVRLSFCDGGTVRHLSMSTNTLSLTVGFIHLPDLFCLSWPMLRDTIKKPFSSISILVYHLLPYWKTAKLFIIITLKSFKSL